MTDPQTIAALLQRGAEHHVALVAPARPPLTYAEMRVHVASTTEQLGRLGIGPGDRVAIVLPNGPELAAAFVSVAVCATAAPLNPGYSATEFEFYLADLGAVAMIVAAGDDSPAVQVAAKLHISVIDLAVPSTAPAGIFTLAQRTAPTRPRHGGPADDDVALVLHTSGTTSRPKMVPLSQRNLCASARHVGEVLGLAAADRCLNIMPLFHIHGLVAAVLASFQAGASVACTPGFNGFKFFAWLQELSPSWYTAVPTMHHMILERAAHQPAGLQPHTLRLIRSSSAPLPPRLMAALEDAFAVPVIESYGMTEGAHQIASNPLPPRPRKPGSVGMAAGPDIGVVDAAGNFLAAGGVGEVVIRGPNVTRGYAGAPSVNADAFIDGWLRTGDQGVLDADGYLTLTGRLKEIINRGGEKISPREIDEVLLEHPAVAQAIAFALPHERLGEEVAAAVVLRPDTPVTPAALRAFAAERLAAFKIPRTLLIVDEIPRGPTGKLQRIGLAEKLGLAPAGRPPART